MDWVKIIAIAMPIVTSVAGGTGYVAYSGKESERAYAMARYRAAKELGRACMGEESFDAEWKQILADIKESEGRE